MTRTGWHRHGESAPLRSAARRVASLLPEPLADAARLAEARRLESRVRRSPAIRGAALVLHAVAPSGGDPDVEIDPPLAAQRLDAAAGYLAARYRVVRARELVDVAHGRRAGQRVPVAITFDDDLPSHQELAAPTLSRHGIVATAFVCGGERPFWWQLLQAAVDRQAVGEATLAPLGGELVEDALQRRAGAIARLAHAIEDLSPAQRDAITTRLARVVDPPPQLTAEARAQLVAAGWEIGFHTRRHDLLTTLDDEDLRTALRDGRDAVGARTFAYPHGKAGEREALAASEAGYVAAYTGRATVLTERTDAHLIGRLQPDHATLGRFALQLARALSAP